MFIIPEIIKHIIFGIVVASLFARAPMNSIEETYGTRNEDEEGSQTI